MDYTSLDQGMLWVGALFVFMPFAFVGIVLGAWWYGKKHPPEDKTDVRRQNHVS